MRASFQVLLMVLVMLLGFSAYAVSSAADMPSGGKAILPAKDKIEHGRYLAKIAGCNDCHTDGYLLSEGQVSEPQWLTGSGFGWRGPWGTTYASNLRLFVNTLSEEQWMTVARHLKTRPPMPWFGLNSMTDADLLALFQFMRYLGPAGQAAPAYVPPGQEPVTPYALFPSPPQK